MWIEIIVLASIVLMVISIMIVLLVEILHTMKSMRKKRNIDVNKKNNYTNIYRK